MNRLRFARYMRITTSWIGDRVPTFDLNDGFFFSGSIMVIAGGWQISPRWTLVVFGAFYVLVGLFGPGGTRGRSQ